MKTFTIFIILLIFGISATGQDFYYSDNRKIYLEKAEHWLTVQIIEDNADEFRNKTLDKYELKERLHLLPERNFFWVEKRDGFKIEISDLKRETDIARTFPAYYNIDVIGDTIPYIITDVLHVRFDVDISEEDVNKMNEQYFVEIIKKGFDNEYLLRLTEKSPLTTLEVANIYYENDLTIWSLPDFITRIKPETIYDPYFENQWYLNNTGQDGGVVGIDINVLPAWNITTGSEDIIVAVSESGAVGQHEDFYEGQIITGYNAATENNNTQEYVSNHAVCVGGIIASNHNTIGVRGVAPNVKIMPIVLGGFGTCMSKVSAAIDTTWSRGADIINISAGWGEGAYFDNMASALQRAMMNGRNGKGTIVVKSAGNTFGGEVGFPANVIGVLAVGAVTNLNEPANYTPNSDWVDIIAPSRGGTLGIATTDRYPQGYNPGYKYHFYFGGTSAAAPQASGVAALIISENPELPEFLVRNAIKQSATSYGQTNWAGHGRLNAYKALNCAANTAILENQVITTNTNIDGCLCYINNVSIQNGAKLTINCDEVLIDKNFEVELGSELVIE